MFCEDFQVPPVDSRFLATTTSGRVRFGVEVQYDCRGYETLMSDHSANHVTYTCLDSPDGIYDPVFDSSTWDTCALSEYLPVLKSKSLVTKGGFFSESEICFSNLPISQKNYSKKLS